MSQADGIVLCRPGESLCDVTAKSEIFNILLEALLMFLVAGVSSVFLGRLRSPLRKLPRKKEVIVDGRLVKATPPSANPSIPSGSRDFSVLETNAVALTPGNDAPWRGQSLKE